MLQYTVSSCVLLCEVAYMILYWSHVGSAGSALWIKIRGTSVVTADSTNASELE